MAPYEALYGQKCRSSIHWDEVGEKKVLDPTTTLWIKKAYEKVKLIRQRYQVAQSRQKNYANNRRKDLKFNTENKIFLEVTPLKGSIKTGKGNKSKSRYIGPFDILHPVRKVAY